MLHTLFLVLFKILDFYIRGSVYVLARIAAVLAPLLYAFCQEIFYLSVYGAEVIFCP